jgi:hypothetical protein
VRATKQGPRPTFAVVIAVALLLAGCSILEDDRLGSGPHLLYPESSAISYLAVRDEGLDAEVLWNHVHDDIKAATSRSEFIECAYAGAGRTGPASVLPESDEYEPEIGNVAMQGGEVTSTNVLVRGEVTYSVVDRRENRGILSVDVQVEGPESTSVTTVLLSPAFEDPHDPGGSSTYWGGGDLGDIVVGTVPEDPCLVGSSEVREQLQTTGTISIGRPQGQRPGFVGYRVLAVAWDNASTDRNLVGGAFWWMGDEGHGGDGLHPPSGDSTDTTGELEDEPATEGDVVAEPLPSPDWVDQAFLTTTNPRIEPGTYTIEVWANPGKLIPSTNPRIPAETNERHCIINVEVTAGTHLNLSINDIPSDDGECPHETQLR